MDGNPIGAGAGAAAGLQEVLLQRFKEAIANKQMQQEQQRIAIEQQRVNNESDLKRMQLQQALDEHKASQQVATQKADEGYMGMTSPGTNLGPSGSPAMAHAAGAGMSGPQFVQNIAPTLSSRNITGIDQAAPTASTAPKIVGLASTPNPGAPEKNIFQGTYAQKNQQQVHADALASQADARQQRADALNQGEDFQREMRQFSVDNRPKPQDHFQFMTVPDPTDPTGKKMIVVRANAQTGEAAPVQMGGQNLGGKAANDTLDATTKNRLQSAKAVVQTGDDIAKELSKPDVAAALGPIMSRYSNIADFVGNPPKGYAHLAGLIESYALANMGVHGMRSNTGAEAIKATLGQGRHTPESMMEALTGLNGFANHLLQNNGQTADMPATAGAAPSGPAAVKETPEQRIKRLLGGG